MTELAWWQKAVFYQIYPRSFADGNGDGIGDIPGIIEKLDYLKDLGVDAIWLSPHYPSPLFDVGYDVSDYCGVAPEYGTLDDFKRFLDESHARGIRVILDLVLNHTSDQHPWFLESKSSRDNPKRDWYVWRDPQADGSPPNNWFSTFGGSAWEYDPATGQSYYHYFFKQQPDLNWRNPEVREAVYESMRFWFRLGVDGFRMDAIGTIFEDPNLTDAPRPVSQAELYRRMRYAKTAEEREQAWVLHGLMHQYQHDLPEVHDLFRELRKVVDEFPDRMLVGETDDIAYYGDGTDEVHMVFNFPLMRLKRLIPAAVRFNQAQRLGLLPSYGWPCNTFGNHDSPRTMSQLGDGAHDWQIARLGLALMLTLKGTPFLYNGEEIGMSDYILTDLAQFRDMLGVWFYENETQAFGVPPEQAVVNAARNSRDKCRTPMQWRNAPNGGFSPAGVAPWLPVNPNYAQGVNVEEQWRDPGSLLNFYRQMLALRKQTPALIAGGYQPLLEESDEVLAFLRDIPGGQRCLVALNCSDKPQSLDLALNADGLRPLFSSAGPRATVESPAGLALAPFEIYIAELG